MNRSSCILFVFYILTLVLLPPSYHSLFVLPKNLNWRQNRHSRHLHRDQVESTTTRRRRSTFSRLYNNGETPQASNTASTEKITPAHYSSDLYKVLGVSQKSSTADIKNAYLTIVKNNHPDRNKVNIL